MRKLIIGILLLTSVTVSYAQFDYQKVLKKYIENQLKTSPCSIDKDFKDFKKWQVMNYPVNNFGLLTLYEIQTDNSYSFSQDMWGTLGYKNNEIPSEYQKWLDFDGFSSQITNGPSINITNDQDKKKFGLGFLFPTLLKALNLDFNFNRDKTTVVNLQVESFYPRCLRRSQSNSFLNGATPEPTNNRMVDPDIKKHFVHGDYAIVVGDVIVKNLTITIDADLNTTAGIEAKFGADFKPQVFSSADLKFNYERNQKGQYKFTITSPMVVARLIKKQPSGGTSSGTIQFFEDWKLISASKIPLPKQ